MFQFTRTINIISDDLGGSSAPTLLLTFDEQPMQGIYNDYFPVVWKLGTFPTEGPYAMKATYKNQLVFINPQVENDKVISAATWAKINLGQQTELIEDSDSATKSFTAPTRGAGAKYIKAINKTRTPQTIGVGFDDGATTPPPSMLVFKDVGATYNVTAEFTPTLRIYITADYKENSILRGEIQSPVIWSKNLAALDENTTWILKRDPLSREYLIVSTTST